MFKKLNLGLLVIASSFVLLTIGCKTNPHKAEEAETILKNGQDAGGGVTVGQNDSGEVVTNRKVKLADQLGDLQKEVYELEWEIYGNEKLGRRGMYGVLRECMDKSGELKRLPAKSLLTKSEDKHSGKMVIDEKKNLVNVSEEYFLDRIKRFEGYKDGYENQKEDFQEKLRICKSEAAKAGQ